MAEQHLRIGDAEREKAASELTEHYVAGRLTTEEHAERLDRVWAARTRADLEPVFRDLPGGPPYAVRGGWAAPEPRRPRGPRGWPAPLLFALAVLVALTVVTHLPLILIGLLVWCFLVSRRSFGPGGRRWSGPIR